MTQYDNTNSGTLGKNKNKENDNQPDYRGQINVAGVDYWLSAWLKTNSTSGEKFFSLSVQPKEDKPQASAEPNNSNFDEDVPF